MSPGLLTPAGAVELLDGVRCRIAARDHEVTNDEPTRLGDTDVSVERELRMRTAA